MGNCGAGEKTSRIVSRGVFLTKAAGLEMRPKTNFLEISFLGTPFVTTTRAFVGDGGEMCSGTEDNPDSKAEAPFP